MQDSLIQFPHPFGLLHEVSNNKYILEYSYFLITFAYIVLLPIAPFVESYMGLFMFGCCSTKLSDVNSKFNSLFLLFVIDIDECTTYNLCPRGRCINTEGSFSCVDCGNGYIASMDGRMCEGIYVA